ncbi:DoxX family protein [Altibacter sp.]|uniref:DoxX family protein n=1 Tax=Altibacter sp. TaxID=2024823 RepID=UPI000C8C0BA7|nr:DoxX family protein [Altibacter sp.]MAP54662.1 DoxX family protein [Altibacter sp.]|tara:strand:- start:189 stop:566 length:378 start_codon:yes stop_codon:yes gene_type:complete
MNNTTRYHLGLLLLRIGFAGMMLTHGIPKLLKLLSGNFEFGDPIGLGEPVSLVLAVLGEAICPLLIIVGFKTRWAAIPAFLTMGVAAFIVHGDDPFASKEKALLYLVGFLVIALLGAGKYALDKN